MMEIGWDKFREDIKRFREAVSFYADEKLEGFRCFIDNIRYHFDVFSDTLEQDKAEERKLDLKRHELAFLPAVQEITETPASPLGRLLIYVITFAFMIVLVWSILGKVDIIATATGRIIPSSHAKVIQPLEAGVIRTIYIRDGQRVTEGEVLIEMDSTKAQADTLSLTQESLAKRMEVARLTAQLEEDPASAFVPPEGAPIEQINMHKNLLLNEISEEKARQEVINSEISANHAKSKVINAEIGRLEKILPNIKARVDAKRELMEQKIVARNVFLELEQQLIELEEQKKVETQRLDEAKAELETLTNQQTQAKAEFKRNLLGRLTKAEEELNSIKQELIKASERQRLMTLTAPVDGVIQQLSVHTIGGVVTPAQQLMVIVPTDSRLEIEAMLPNKDIGFVHDGQIAEVKVESFPFTRYGTIPASVKHVSRDSVQDENAGLVYPLQVTMAKDTILVGDKHVPLSPGMAVTVEIKTGKRRVIEYILAPLVKYQSESMRER